MMPVLEESAILRQMHPISVETYHRLAEIGHLSERTELIRGVIIDKMSQSPLHASIVELLRDHLLTSLSDDCVLRQEKPLTIGVSEPEPDLAIVRGARRDFLTRHPRTAALVIEAAVSSEDLDRVKLGLYAEAGVPEAWLVLAEERVLERHTEPRDGRYQHVERATFPAQLPSSVFPGVILPPAGLFGA